ncbi:MAG: hypothetical protein NT144_03680 [Bacteroidia bacterium]|nr:hypothetical protein [Bacteroidia bacterium]
MDLFIIVLILVVVCFKLTHILLKDPEYPVEITLNIKSFSTEDVIEQWVEIVQKEAKPVTVYNYASSMRI